VPSTAPRLVHDLIAALDYGQFSLCGSSSPDSDYMTLLEAALAGPHVASDGHGVVVCSPHQNNFRMPLRVEVWDDPPPDDAGRWEEIFESSLTVEEGSLRYDSPTLDSVSCNVPNGRYVVRICGRGFINRGWPGSTLPGDVWRVQLWPGADHLADRCVKAWQPPQVEPVGDDLRET
jgi:hypothetical protein